MPNFRPSYPSVTVSHFCHYTPPLHVTRQIVTKFFLEQGQKIILHALYQWYSFTKNINSPWYHRNICDINLTSGSWDWTNQTLISSWHRRDNRPYPAERNPSGLYATLVSATIMPYLYCSNWKLKLQATFSQLLQQKFLKYFQTALLYLKVISNILNRNTYWERRTKMPLY